MHWYDKRKPSRRPGKVLSRARGQGRVQAEQEAKEGYKPSKRPGKGTQEYHREDSEQKELLLYIEERQKDYMLHIDGETLNARPNPDEGN